MGWFSDLLLCSQRKTSGKGIPATCPLLSECHFILFFRDRIHPTCHSFWGRLYVHFVQLLKYEIMNPDEVAAIFAPLLIAEESPHEEKVYCYHCGSL
jgi:hypothetical protein